MVIFGVLMVLMGGVWFLQGINVLPGSFMTGELRWAVYGGILALAGSGCCGGQDGAVEGAANIWPGGCVVSGGEAHVLHKVRDRTSGR